MINTKNNEKANITLARRISSFKTSELIYNLEN